ncbi:hypothetical protein CKO50_21320 [Pseudoalteromonas sp. HM-SA03]|uniref:hypothetical protein n=1 Tax=Pseudoalteromonas sp. HM-SA03 TaxID=2029678 RepID=UPI000BADF374|nr:hypothetical protein [Pseudoalteromonas sp. HM-SA03]PAX99381.1 hypothetical protein CKO50_21320 [Pseudoalteromonas sp. HM-SA03]
MTIRKKKKFKVGDNVGVFGRKEPGIVEKITPTFLRIDGNVIDIDRVYRLDSPHFCKRKIVPKISSMREFFSDIPKEIDLKELSLNLSFENDELEELWGSFDDFDPLNHIYDGEDDEGEINCGGLFRLIEYIKELELRQKDPDSIIVFKDCEAHTQLIIFDFFVTTNKASGYISGKYISPPIFVEEGVEPIQETITSWYDKHPELHEHMQSGAKYRKSLLSPNRKRHTATDRTLVELELVDNLLIKCLTLWPGRYLNKSDTIQSLLHEFSRDEDLIYRLDILTDLILSKGLNQIIPEIEDIDVDNC